MNRKIIGILGLVGLVLTGCAAPEVGNRANNDGFLQLR